MSVARRPDLFIIGAPKSGTTSLYEYLLRHPQVFMSPTKEPFYFCPDARMGPRPRLEYPADEARYLELFAGAGKAVRLGEATTRYLGSGEAPRLVRDFSPDAYIVASLREPVTMLQALHNERVANGNEDITDFGAALEADDDRRRGRRLPPGANSRGAVYRDVARYADQLEHWLEAFGPERVQVIVFDDLVADPAATFRRLLEFLDVDTDYRPAEFAAHNRRYRPRRSVRVVTDSRLGRLVSDRALPALIGESRRAQLALRFRHSRLVRQQVIVEPVAPAIRAALEREFEPDVVRLSALIGRDLGLLWFGKSLPVAAS
ncbi:MAG: sulfotransferase [Chloroflexota bacterium]